MHAPTLIRTHHDVETPAAGTWTIDHGWAVAATWRAGLRHRRAATRALGGTLVVGPEPGALRLAVVVDTRPVEAVAAESVRVRTTAIRPTTDGRWWADAVVDPVVDGHAGPSWAVVHAELRYHGVFRIGDGARARLALRVRVAVPADGSEARRRPVVVDLAADVDAEAPRSLVTAARAEAVLARP